MKHNPSGSGHMAQDLQPWRGDGSRPSGGQGGWPTEWRVNFHQPQAGRGTAVSDDLQVSAYSTPPQSQAGRPAGREAAVRTAQRRLEDRYLWRHGHRYQGSAGRHQPITLRKPDSIFRQLRLCEQYNAILPLSSHENAPGLPEQGGAADCTAAVRCQRAGCGAVPRRTQPGRESLPLQLPLSEIYAPGQRPYSGARCRKGAEPTAVEPPAEPGAPLRRLAPEVLWPAGSSGGTPRNLRRVQPFAARANPTPLTRRP
ncbi:hypothetical protein SS50377_21527 [Spironucleus salmonicida]|nr:hypothetical protein SS50377_21527 [Spironucleus salmonicida]